MTKKEKVNILLIDDQPSNLIFFEKILTALDINLIKATSDAEVITCLKKSELALILLDIQTDNISGLKLAEKIRQQTQSKTTPLILLASNHSNQSYLFKGSETGAVDCLFKPFEKEVLINKVNFFIDLYKKNQSLIKTSNDLNKALENLKTEIAERKRNEAAGEFGADK